MSISTALGNYIMRRTCLLMTVMLFAGTSAQADVSSDCTFNGIELKGEAEIVDSFPDIKVQKVDSFPDLKVQLVDSFPDECGKWKEVSSSGDFKVQYVDSFPDIKVEIVDSFPGLP